MCNLFSPPKVLEHKTGGKGLRWCPVPPITQSGGVSMRRVRIEPKARRDKDERPVLPVDPRDPDIVRAKRAASGELRDKRL